MISLLFAAVGLAVAVAAVAVVEERGFVNSIRN